MLFTEAHLKYRNPELKIGLAFGRIAGATYCYGVLR